MPVHVLLRGERPAPVAGGAVDEEIDAAAARAHRLHQRLAAAARREVRLHGVSTELIDNHEIRAAYLGG